MNRNAAASDTIALSHVKQNELFKNNVSMEDNRVQRPGTSFDPNNPVDRVHERGLAFARLAPRTFLLAWCVFGIMAVLLHFK